MSGRRLWCRGLQGEDGYIPMKAPKAWGVLPFGRFGGSAKAPVRGQWGREQTMTTADRRGSSRWGGSGRQKGGGGVDMAAAWCGGSGEVKAKSRRGVADAAEAWHGIGDD